MTRLQTALADIAWLTEHWPMLLETRLPGTARPWRQTDLSAEHRQQLDADARAERLDRAELAPGETPAPVHVDVLDVLAELTITAEQLAEQTAAAAGCSLLLPPASSAYADPRSYLTHLAIHLPDADHDALDDAATRLAALRRAAAGALRLVYDGQRLAGDCPWCHQPRALVVRLPASDQLPMLVVCESPVVCEPPERDCGKSVRGRPAWPYYEWEWLGDRIRHADAQEPAAAQPTARALKIAIPADPEGCWLWQGAAADLPAPDAERTCARASCLNPRHLPLLARHAEGAA